MRKHDGRAIPNFVNQALENKDFQSTGMDYRQDHLHILMMLYLEFTN